MGLIQKSSNISVKKDSPSGTADRLLEIIRESRQLTSVNVTHGRNGMIGERNAMKLIALLRGGDVVGEHTVMLAGMGERIELTHRATDRVIFARSIEGSKLGAIAKSWIVFHARCPRTKWIDNCHDRFY